MENKNNILPRNFFNTQQLSRFISICALLATIVAAIFSLHSVLDARNKIESTMTYKDVDSTEVLKLINEMNKMYSYNKSLRDSINALNDELEKYRNHPKNNLLHDNQEIAETDQGHKKSINRVDNKYKPEEKDAIQATVKRADERQK